MEKSFAYVLGVICGILAVAIFCLIMRKIATKKVNKSAPKEYDERQIIARGKSYKTGMLTFVIVTLICTLLETLDVHFAQYPLLLLLILLIGAFAFVVDAIFRDAYFRVGDSTKMWWLILIGIANIFLSFINCKDGFIKDGLLVVDSLNLIVGIWIIVIFVIICIKKYIDKKASDTADEE